MIYFYFVIIELKNDFIGKNAEKEDIILLAKNTNTLVYEVLII